MNKKQLFITDRDKYNELVYSLKCWYCTLKKHNFEVGLNGYMGLVMFLFNLARITNESKYKDGALQLLECNLDFLYTIKDNLCFYNGITGCCWLLELLYRRKDINFSPEKMLEDVDVHLSKIVDNNINILSIEELCGIGKYYLIKNRNRPSNNNWKQFSFIAEKLKANMVSIPNEENVAIDAVEILQGNNYNIKKDINFLERRILQGPCTQINQVFNVYRLYKLTNDLYFKKRAYEDFKLMRSKLMTFDDALMISDLLLNQDNKL